ncbi:MAG: hypothetical protein NTW95_03565 [Candidatus Aminicenantes bacterium]|nr:hypothetical protein [Candidatus Aminicenantes bacterium]
MKTFPAALLLFAFFLLAGVPAAVLDFPGDNFSPGWVRSGPCARIDPAGLYNVIDGGAELFLEMGFIELQVQKYAGAGAEIAIEAYRMESEAAALGIYLLKCSRETTLPGISARHSGDRFQIALLKGNYFIFINNFSGRQELLPVMTALAQQIGQAIPAGSAVRELDILPAENQVPGTALLLRGPYSLQAVYTLGAGDILQLGGRMFAAAAVYREASGASYTMIVAPYADDGAARAAFANLRGHLDRYIQDLGGGADFFNFKDFQNYFGRAEIRANKLVILVKLAQRPDSRLE